MHSRILYTSTERSIDVLGIFLMSQEKHFLTNGSTMDAQIENSAIICGVLICLQYVMRRQFLDVWRTFCERILVTFDDGLMLLFAKTLDYVQRSVLMRETYQSHKWEQQTDST